MEDKCVICGLVLDHVFDFDNIVVVKERGLKKFIESSLIRVDGKEECFKDRAEIRLHKKCRNTYNNPKCIEAERKRKKNQSGRKQIPPLRQLSDRNSECTIEFDFQNKSLFCDTDASVKFEEKQNKVATCNRISVGQVKKLETQNTIHEACHKHDDEWSRQVLMRIDKVNIVEKNARYHYGCYSKFCHPYRAAGVKRGRQQSEPHIMDQVYNFIEKNQDDCPFSLLEIREALNHITLPSDQMIKYHLKQKYGDKVIITSGNPSIICFVPNSLKIIQNSWHEKRNKNDDLKKLRIVETAGKIILQEIKSSSYKTDTHPPPLESVKNDCPQSLLLLLETVIMNNKKGNDHEQLERKCLTIAHSVLSAVPP